MDDIMRSTNFVKATYTEIIDLQTVNGKCSIIGIHTPTGAGPYNKLKGYFTQYRKYKYGGIDSMVMCPAANLPVDPLGLTGVVGTTDLMDPRDALNPIMFHGCHGESMADVLNTLFSKHQTNSVVDRLMNPTVGFESQSADKLDLPFQKQISATVTQAGAEDSYYRFLTDPKWRKFGIQSMVKLRKLRPLTWKVASTMPYLPNTSNLLVGNVSDDANSPLGPTTKFSLPGIVPNAPDFDTTTNTYTAHRVQMQQFTNGVTPLGWLPTTVLTNEQVGTSTVWNTHSEIVRLPKLFMGCLVLPPSYNVEQFFRLSIRHNFYFKDFTQSLTPLYDTGGIELSEQEYLGGNPGGNSYFNWIDYTDSGSKVIVGQSEVDHGTTLDVVDGKSSVVSDSAM